MKKKYIIFYNGVAFVYDSIDEVNLFIGKLKKEVKCYRNGLVVVDISGCSLGTVVDMSVDYGYLYGLDNSLTLRDKMKELYADYMVDLDELEVDGV